MCPKIRALIIGFLIFIVIFVLIGEVTQAIVYAWHSRQSPIYMEVISVHSSGEKGYSCPPVNIQDPSCTFEGITMMVSERFSIFLLFPKFNIKMYIHYVHFFSFLNNVTMWNSNDLVFANDNQTTK